MVKVRLPNNCTLHWNRTLCHANFRCSFRFTHFRGTEVDFDDEKQWPLRNRRVAKREQTCKRHRTRSTTANACLPLNSFPLSQTSVISFRAQTPVVFLLPAPAIFRSLLALLMDRDLEFAVSSVFASLISPDSEFQSLIQSFLPRARISGALTKSTSKIKPSVRSAPSSPTGVLGTLWDFSVRDHTWDLKGVKLSEYNLAVQVEWKRSLLSRVSITKGDVCRQSSFSRFKISIRKSKM